MTLEKQNNDTALLARAGEELALLLEFTTGYPDDPDRLLRIEPKASSVATNIFRRLVEVGEPIPAPLACLVAHLHAPDLLRSEDA
jgi:hypothetical protein